jgi:CHAD domain-containing protein
LSGIEQRMLAAAVYFHRKRFKRKRLRTEAVTSLPRGVREDTLALAALLRVADGLSSAQEQSSELQQIRVTPAAVHVIVSGPFAGVDAAAAQAKADLWEHLFDVPFFIVAPDTAAKPVQVAESLPPSASVEVPDAQSLKSPGLVADDLMGEAGRKVLFFHFLRMLAHEPGTRLGQDIEELHDMRVATRRMRSAFRVFGSHLKTRVARPYVVGLRRTARALGAVRDLDVLMEKAKAYLADLPQEREHDLDPLLSLWREQRETARKEMMAHLDSAKYRDFCEGFRLFLEAPGVGLRKRKQFPPQPAKARHVVPTLVYTRWANVQAFGSTLEGASISTLHALRIEFKRLRYTLEFFREILGPQVKQVIGEVVQLQDHLGDLNDADVANTQLSDFLFAASRGNAKDAPKPVIAPGVVAYLATKQRELQNLVLTFPDVWAQFNRPEVRRWLADAVAVL